MAVGGSQLVVGGGWRLAVGGWQRLAVGGGWWSRGAVLSLPPLSLICGLLLVPAPTACGSQGLDRSPGLGCEKEGPLEGERAQGVVKWYDATKGYGYIMHPSMGDVYVHVSTLEAHGLSYVSTGMLMSFMMRNNSKGKEAFNVQLVGEQPRVRGVCACLCGAALEGARVQGGFKRRLQQRLLPAGKRFQSPCWRLQNGWRATA